MKGSSLKVMPANALSVELALSRVECYMLSSGPVRVEADGEEASMGSSERRAKVLEAIVRDRAKQLFHSDHAIVRLGNIVAASRVVFQALLAEGDMVLSLNLRKKRCGTLLPL